MSNLGDAPRVGDGLSAIRAAPTPRGGWLLRGLPRATDTFEGRPGEIVLVGLRIVREMTDDDWVTNEDEIFAGTLDVASGRFAISVMPTRFPVRDSGAYCAKRAIGTVVRVEGTGEILFPVRSPFSDARGSGKDGYLVSVTPDGAWRVWSKALRTAPAPRLEREIPVVSSAELEIRAVSQGRLAVIADATPYLLDDGTPVSLEIAPGPLRVRALSCGRGDWEQSPELTAAIAAMLPAELAHRGAPRIRWRSTFSSAIVAVIEEERVGPAILVMPAVNGALPPRR